MDNSLLSGSEVTSVNNRNNYLELLSHDENNHANNEFPELVFIDSTVADSEIIIDNISGAAEVIILDDRADGLQQISDVLSQHQELDAVHLVSYGDAGQLFLGDTQLNIDHLTQYADVLAGWNDFLTEDADLLLYGCDIASSEEGMAFVEEFSQLTNADVLASNDTTGSDLLNGDWDLEVAIGNVETEVIFNSEISDLYQHLLNDNSPNDNSPLESVSLSLDYNVDLSLDYGDLIIETGIFEDNFDDYDFSNLDGSELNFSVTELDIDFSSTNFESIDTDATLDFEFYDSDGDVVIAETDFTAVDYSFINNPQGINFDGDFYLANNPLVANAGIDPFTHYMQTGWQEGRDPSPFFDTTFYLNSHSDVRSDGINPLEHYNTSGWKELRDPTPFFDTSHYLESHTDVLEDGMNPLEHFENTGWREGRNPNPFFQTEFYLNNNPRVRESGMNPLHHYISSGESEGRLPSVFFDGDYYLEKNTDVAQSAINSLEHFLRSGYREGRLSNRVFESPDRVLIAQSVLDEGIPGFNPIRNNPAWFIIGGTIKLIENFVNGGYELQVDSVQSFTFSDSETGTPPFPGETERPIQVEVFPNGNIDDILDSSIFTFPSDDEGEYTIFSNPSGEQELEDILNGGRFTFPDIGEDVAGSYFLSIDRNGNPIGYNPNDLSNIADKNNGLNWEELKQRNGTIDVAGVEVPKMSGRPRTLGAFFDPNNGTTTTYSSGEADISSLVRPEIRNSVDEEIYQDFKLVFGHAEGHAASTIRTYNLEKGRIFINNSDGPCGDCIEGLPYILKSGQTLDVIHVNRQGTLILDTFKGGIEYNPNRDRTIIDPF